MENYKSMNKEEKAIKWLKNGIWALAMAGLYSIVLVLLRTPQTSIFFANKSLFKSSLIIHVNLSVLVWLLSIACVIWSYGNKKLYFENIISKLAFAGMFLMAVSPLIGANNPIMNNYIPILENIWFIIGLSIFGSSLLYFSILVFIYGFHDFDFKGEKYLANILPMVKITSSAIYIMAWVCFTLSYREVTNLSSFFPIDIDYYYELLFWSGGHLLQFIYTQIVMYIWLVFAELWLGRKLQYYKIYNIIFIINFLLSILIFYGHFAYQMPEYEFKDFFTKHMQYTGGIAPISFILLLIIDILKSKKEKFQNNLTFISTAFFASIFLFFVGGLIGILISGVNLSIPAHYHGTIVGISIAFLGFAYMFCFQDSICIEILTNNLKLSLSYELFKFKPGSQNDKLNPLPAPLRQNSYNFKWPNIQLYLITVGQLLHISGLALAGGYGVLRKNPEGFITISAKIYMGMMGGGGLIAIIGGLMFVYICATRLLNK